MRLSKLRVILIVLRSVLAVCVWYGKMVVNIERKAVAHHYRKSVQTNVVPLRYKQLRRSDICLETIFFVVTLGPQFLGHSKN